MSSPRLSSDATESTQLLNTGDLVADSFPSAVVPVDPDDTLVGVRLNQTYIVERRLGEGGMGRVYLARHTRIAQKRVAVKVLHSEFTTNNEWLARFQREAETAAAISHPNVVTVLDLDRTPQGHPYMVCEYLEGVDLHAHLGRIKRCDPATAIHVARQLCRGLAAAHEKGVEHRDLKPQNVFLVGDFTNGVPERPHVKLLDFGLSRFVSSSPNEVQLTKTGMIMGTPAYMAPEQASGAKTDHRVDVYGVGAILYAAMTGRPPFEEGGVPATMLAVINKDPPRPRSLNGAISPRLELVIERAMAKNPAERFPNVTALEQALADVQSVELGAPTVSAAPPPPTAGRKGRGVSLSEEDAESPRLRLVLHLLAGFALLLAGAAIAVPGVEEASGHRFTPGEIGYFLLAVAGTSLTPALLWLRRMRRNVWTSSTRVLALLGDVRASILAGVLAYALGSLALHVVDDFVVRFTPEIAVKPVGATWPGWNLLLPVIALSLGGAVVWRRRLLAGPRSWSRTLGAGLVTLLACAFVGGVIDVGLAWRAGSIKTLLMKR